MSLRPVRAVFFDLDDTLCAYWDASKAALRETFATHGPDHLTVEEQIAHWAAAFRKLSPTLKKTHWYDIYLKTGGPTRNEQMRLTLLEMGIDDPERAVKMGDLYGLRRDENLQLFPEALEVLDVLRGRYPMGLITNGPADIQRQEVETTGVEPYFDPILIEGEMGFGKPDSRVYDLAHEAIASKIGEFAPEEVLMVGNSYSADILGAHAMGWQTAWIRRPSDVPPSQNQPEAKPENGPEPTVTIGDLRELLQWLA